MKKVSNNGNRGKPAKVDFESIAKADDTKQKGPTEKQLVILETKGEHPELTVREIAKLADTTHPHVIRTLRQYGLETRHDVDLFKKNRAAILAGVQGDLISTYYTLSDEDKRKLIKRRGLVDMGIAYDKERLEEGLSTENVLAVIADLEAIRKARNPIIKHDGIVTGAGHDTRD